MFYCVWSAVPSVPYLHGTPMHSLAAITDGSGGGHRGIGWKDDFELYLQVESYS